LQIRRETVTIGKRTLSTLELLAGKKGKGPSAGGMFLEDSGPRHPATDKGRCPVGGGGGAGGLDEWKALGREANRGGGLNGVDHRDIYRGQQLS